MIEYIFFCAGITNALTLSLELKLRPPKSKIVVLWGRLNSWRVEL